MKMSESQEVTVFDPNKLSEMVKTHVKGVFASLIPDNYWDQAIKKVADGFFNSRIITDYYHRGDTVLAVDASYRSVSLQYGGSFMAISPEEMASKELAFREIIEDACVIAGIECRALGWFVAGVIC